MLPMKHIANWALNIAALRGASYADVRVVAQRSRSLTTKNGKVGSASDAESVGMNVRAIVDGAWGFAASAELGRGAGEAARGDPLLPRNWGGAQSRRLPRGPWKSLALRLESNGTMYALLQKSRRL